MKSAILLLFASAGFRAELAAERDQRAVREPRFFGRSGFADSRRLPNWFGYAVKTARSDNQSCCWNGAKSIRLLARRRIEQAQSPAHARPAPCNSKDRTLSPCSFASPNNTVEKVRVYSLSCPLDAGGLPFIWLTGVPANASLSYLEKLAAANNSTHVADGAVFAISQHDDPAALDLLIRLARNRFIAARARPGTFLAGPKGRKESVGSHHRCHRERSGYAGKEARRVRALAAAEGRRRSETDRDRAHAEESGSPQTGVLLAGAIERSPCARLHRGSAHQINARKFQNQYTQSQDWTPDLRRTAEKN